MNCHCVFVQWAALILTLSPRSNLGKLVEAVDTKAPWTEDMHRAIARVLEKHGKVASATSEI